MFQQVTLVGNLGRDPEMRYTQSGTPVTSFSMATNEKWTGTDGENKERTTWWKVTAWKRQAESANKYLSKGSKVLVIGTMVVDDSGGPKIWSDREGNPRASLEINARTIQFLDSRSAGPSDDDVPEEADIF